MLHSVIKPDTLQFLRDLKENNNREWFTEHKSRFRASEANFKEFMQALQQMMSQHDELEKMKIFRIYRDVRFSNDKTPYKNSLSGFFARAGNHRRGGYYVHLQPEGSFIASGFWKPSKEDLFRIRKEWELDADELMEVMEDPGFKTIWGTMGGEEVATAPKGFDRNHPNIGLIRKKQFVFIKEFPDKEILRPDFINEVNLAFETVRPYFDLMSNILTTNLNGESIILD